MTVSIEPATEVMKNCACFVSTIKLALMYKRSVKPICDFLGTQPDRGVHY